MTSPIKPPTPDPDAAAPVPPGAGPGAVPPGAGPGAVPPGAPVQPIARTPRWLVIAIVAAILVVALMLAAAITLAGRRGGSPAQAAHTVTAPLAGAAEQSEFQLLNGVTAVTVRTGDLGGDLYRISTPRDSGAVPHVVHDHGQVQLDLVKTNGAGSSTVDVRLSNRVRWNIRLIGGSSSATVDARDAKLSGVDFTGGVTRIELWLPRPSGRIVARMAGGASEMAVHAPTNVPTRVRIGSGAATAVIDGVTHSGIAPGTTYAPGDWEQATDRFDVDASAGVATLTLDRY